MLNPNKKYIRNDDKKINKELYQIIKNKLNNKYSNFNFKNLSYLNVYAIDDIDTIEVDDAISIERIETSYKIWIHIASPTHVFKYNSEIDIRARKKISTLYLSNNIIYMLPKKLIKNIISLNNMEKRIALSVGVILDNDGEVISYEVIQSYIKTLYHLSYEEADELIDYSPKEEDDLYIISNLLDKRRNWRLNKGAIQIYESQGRIKVKDNKAYINIIEPTKSRQLVSEAMILYGDIISSFTKEKEIPVPYRVQQNCIVNNKYNSIENEILKNYYLKKQLGKTYYSIQSSFHASLGLDSYLHATSPIRRYSDLLVHYQIYNYLNKFSLINEGEIEEHISLINSIGKENIIKYREDQKKWLNIWFKNNNLDNYRISILNWVNYHKKIALVYFMDYHVTLICSLKGVINVELGEDNLYKNITIDYDDLLVFKLV